MQVFRKKYLFFFDKNDFICFNSLCLLLYKVNPYRHKYQTKINFFTNKKYQSHVKEYSSSPCNEVVTLGIKGRECSRH